MKKLYILISFSFFLASACTKEEINTPSFQVSVNKTDFNAGDTVRFRFSGNADYITFYSGERGHEYQYRDRTVLPGGNVEMSFSTNVQFGSQQGNLQVWASTDFEGVYTPDGVAAANWTEITSRFNFATSTTFTTSGLRSVNDIVQPAKPLFIAFRYVGQAAATATQRTWRVNNLLVKTTFPDGTTNTLANQSTAGWTFVNVANTANTWAVTGADIIFRPNSTLAYSEDWAVTGALTPDKTNPDTGVPIKNYSNNRMDEYSYIFNTPGTYTVTFVAINEEIDGRGDIVRQINIVVQ
jgi:hypothetical protein